MADSPLTDEEMRALFGDGNAPAVPSSTPPPPAASPSSPLTPEQERVLFPPAAAPPSTAAPGVTPADALESFQAGTLQGMGNVAGGVQRIFGYDPTLTERTNALLTPEQKAGMTAHPWAAGGGRILGETAATAPVMIAGGELLPTFGAVSTPAILARAGLYGTGFGAVGNMLTSGGSPDEPLWHRALTGAEWGLPFGMLGGYAEAAAGAGQTISPGTQAAGKAMKAADVDVAPGNLPRAGGAASARGAAPTEAQAGQINKAWGNIIGEDTPDFSPQTNAQVFKNLGDEVGKTAAAGQVDQHALLGNGNQTLDQKLSEIESDFPNNPYVTRQIKAIRDVFDANNGIMPGDELQTLIQKNGLLERSTRSRIAERADPAVEIEQALKNGFDQSSAPGVADAYSLAREKYKLAIAAKESLDPATGNIAPASLMRSIVSMYPDNATLGAGPTLTDQAVNFARNAARTFGGSSSATPVMHRGGWLLPAAASLVGGAAEVGPHVLPYALPETVSNPLIAGSLIGAPLLARATIGSLGRAYQESPAFANALLSRGSSVGGPYLETATGGLSPTLGTPVVGAENRR